MRDYRPSQSAAADDAPAADNSPDRLRQLGVYRRMLQRKASGRARPGAEQAVEAAQRSPGQPLPHALEEKYSASLGANLSQVRVHTGGESHQAADAIGASAYTTGNDIHFAAGKYDPSSAGGRELIAHEVAHTVQQARGGLDLQCKCDPIEDENGICEKDADDAAKNMEAGKPADPGAAAEPPKIDLGDAPNLQIPQAVGPGKLEGPAPQFELSEPVPGFPLIQHTRNGEADAALQKLLGQVGWIEPEFGQLAERGAQLVPLGRPQVGPEIKQEIGAQVSPETAKDARNMRTSLLEVQKMQADVDFLTRTARGLQSKIENATQKVIKAGLATKLKARMAELSRLKEEAANVIEMEANVAKILIHGDPIDFLTQVNKLLINWAFSPYQEELEKEEQQLDEREKELLGNDLKYLDDDSHSITVHLKKLSEIDVGMVENFRAQQTAVEDAYDAKDAAKSGFKFDHLRKRIEDDERYVERSWAFMKQAGGAFGSILNLKRFTRFWQSMSLDAASQRAVRAHVGSLDRLDDRLRMHVYQVNEWVKAAQEDSRATEAERLKADVAMAAPPKKPLRP
jgi:hypothetical protein